MVTQQHGNDPYDLIVVGAGPTGLACGLFATRAGLDYLVVDKGTVVNTIVGYPTYTTFFSTPERLSLGDIPFTSPNFRPSRAEAIAYYRGVAESAAIPFALHTRVEGITRKDDLFIIATDRGELRARYVVLATGYFDQTNRLNVPGEDLPHVRHYYKEPFEHFGEQVLVIGGRNSAVETALDLFRNGASVTMVHRGSEFSRSVKYWLRPDVENRITAGEIGMHWNSEVVEIGQGWARVRNRETGEETRLAAHAVYAMIGYRPDEELLKASGIDYDRETLVPAFDPATFETNVPGLFLAGSVACGCKTWEIFIENGREHARTVIDEIERAIRGGEQTSRNKKKSVGQNGVGDGGVD